MSIQRASPGILQRGERHQRGPRRPRVVGDVVAAEHRERRGARAATQIQRLGQVSPRGDVAAGATRSARTSGWSASNSRVTGFEEVSVAGDGQADYAGVGVRQRGADRRAVVRRVVDGADRADHAGGLALVAALHDGVQPVLGRQHVFDVAGTQADAGDPPLVGNARAGQVVEVDGLVRAVKVARTDVYDSALQGRPVVGRHVDSLGMQSKGVVAERNSGAWPPGSYFSHPRPCPRSDPLKRVSGLRHGASCHE